MDAENFGDKWLTSYPVNSILENGGLGPYLTLWSGIPLRHREEMNCTRDQIRSGILGRSSLRDQKERCHRPGVSDVSKNQRRSDGEAYVFFREERKERGNQNPVRLVRLVASV